MSRVQRYIPEDIRENARAALDAARGPLSWRRFAVVLREQAGVDSLSGAAVHLWYKHGAIPHHWVRHIVAFDSVDFAPEDIHESFFDLAASA